MELNDRKIKILEAIITDYISIGEPVGSRTIAKKYNLGVSSATIRNEMSDLEDLGLIEQLHTSSGRVPSDKGYRLYVDKFMTQRELTDEEKAFLQNIVTTNINQIDFLMEETAKALSLLTNYATVVSKPQVEKDKIKHINIMPFDDKAFLVTLVTENKVIKNFEMPYSNNNVLSSNDFININQELNLILNNNNKEVSLSTNNNKIISSILEQSVISLEQENDTKFFTSGINNILEFKEFNTIEKAKSIFSNLEEKEILTNILEQQSILQKSNNCSNIQILIGDEHHIEAFKECSIVKTEYTIAGAKGSIGIIAPTRMDYAKTVSILEGIIKNINDIISKKFPDS
ncbi:MAG: heat-inducible transcriptional repressor HrcA [bacterium]